jgi:hypothetical protein
LDGSKIRDKKEISRLIDNEYKKEIQQRKKKKSQRTTILIDKAIQKEEMVPWIPLRQLGKYGTLSKQTHELTKQLLARYKTERFFLSVYHLLDSQTLWQDRVEFFFEDDVSLAYIAIRRGKETLYFHEAMIHKTNRQLSKSSVMTSLPRIHESIILRKFLPVFKQYNGKLTRTSTYISPYTGRLTVHDKNILSQVF